MRRGASDRSHALVGRMYVGTAVLTGLAVLAKAGVVSTVVPVPPAVIVAVLLLAAAMPILYRRLLRFASWLGPLVLVGVWMTAVVVQPVLLRELHARGRGTDQGDCVSIGLDRLMSGEWPYDSSFMWSDNPMSCGPGWLVAHLPAQTGIGYPATMALLLTLSAIAVGTIKGWHEASVLLTLVGLSPGFWLAYANGNDFATFGMLIVMLVTMAESPRRSVRGLGVFLSIFVSQFRVPFVVLPAVLAIRSATAVRAKVIAGGALVASTSVAIFVAFYLHDPTRMVMDGPFHIFHKFTSMLGSNNSGLVLGVVLVLVSVVLVAIVVRLPTALGVLAYCAAFLLPLSALSLTSSVAAAESPIEVLEYWEGVSWLTSLVCITAGILAAQHSRELPPRPDVARQPAVSIDLSELETHPIPVLAHSSPFDSMPTVPIRMAYPPKRILLPDNTDDRLPCSENMQGTAHRVPAPEPTPFAVRRAERRALRGG